MESGLFHLRKSAGYGLTLLVVGVIGDYWLVIQESWIGGQTTRIWPKMYWNKHKTPKQTKTACFYIVLVPMSLIQGWH